MKGGAVTVMYRYLSADIRRLARRFPRWLIIILALFGMSACVAIAGQLGLYGRWNSFTYVTTVKNLIKPLALIIGIVEIIFLFGDDRKARTLQASIGAGLPRASLVISKYIEVILFSLLDIILYALFTFAMGFLFQANLFGSQYQELWICFFVEWLKVLGYTSLTMILLFSTRGVALGMVLYIAFFARIIEKALVLLLSIGPLERLHIDRYSMSMFIDTTQTHLIGGVSILTPLLAVLVYIAVGCMVSILLFQKKELDL